VYLVLSPPAAAVCPCCRVLCRCSHASIVPARGTNVCAAGTNMGWRLAGIFGYRLAGIGVRTSLAILRWDIARATPIM
jgi:hypothetical protein